MAKKIWRTNKTILLVGEGADEEAFLNHVKINFVSRDSGISVKVKNAQGKGATHVVQWTIRQMATAQYDVVAVMVDTDTGWTVEVQKLARDNGIILLPSHPCFEAVLLRLINQRPQVNPQALKRQLAPFVHDRSTQVESYSEHFGPIVLTGNRIREPSIDELLRILEI
jgi:hypothetical protein